MRKAFHMYDTTKCGFIETIKISIILNTMGQLFDDAELKALIAEIDIAGMCIISNHIYIKILHFINNYVLYNRYRQSKL